MPRTSSISPAPRTAIAAAAAGLGPWTAGFQVNSRRESAGLTTGIISIAVGIGGLIGTALLGIPWFGMLVLGVVLALVTLFGVIMLVAGIQFHRVGRWLIHLYDTGFVMERTHGRVMAASYGDVSAASFTFIEPGDSTSEQISHFGLTLTLPDGAVCSMAEPDYGHTAWLRLFAERCGAAQPAESSYSEAIRKLGEETWGEEP